jgi:excisionase family DNA binding protein
MSDPQFFASVLEFFARVLGILAGVQLELRELREQLRGNAKPLLTVEEIAELTGRTPYTVRRWIKEGVIHAERIQAMGPRGRLLVPRAELSKLVQLGKGADIAGITMLPTNSCSN